MQIFEGVSQIKGKLKNPVVTIGNFDGVHIGHQALFKQVIEKACEIGGVSVVYTFDPHPLKVLQPERPFPLITTREEKEKVIEWVGIEVLIREPFTETFSRMTTEEFVKEVLWEKMQTKEVYIGPDYRFGRGRTGTTQQLKSLGERCGMGVHVLKNVEIDGVEVRSTTIRNYVREGRVKEAARFLGRGYTLKGKVVQGSALGKKLGIPTANILPEKELYPRSGIFAVKVIVQNTYKVGVLNIGTNPTFPGKGFSLEVYILDFSEDIYGSEIELIFVDKLRDEKKFETPASLVEQIKNDIVQARTLLQT